MARRAKINLSADLTDALNMQKPYAKRGYSLAKDAIDCELYMFIGGLLSR